MLRRHGLSVADSEVERKFFGPATRAALLEFQQRSRLPESGELDQATADALGRAAPPPGMPASATTPAGGPDRAGGRPRIGIVLSGWAPAMTLMSGAMLGFTEKGVEFDVISTSGAGALVGLLALAPKNRSPKQALEELPNLFVSDLLYSVLPINFKVFQKFGPFAKPMHELRRRLPKIRLDPQDRSLFGRLLNDWVDLVFCALTPSTFELKSRGLMSPSPLVEDLVDFTKLAGARPSFYLNAFNLDQRRLEIFDKHSANADAYHATEALPVLYAPQRMSSGELYTIGATHDPTGLQAIWLNHKHDLDMVVMLDPMSAAIWRAPVNLHDAFQLMLMNPVMALQMLISALYARTDHIAEGIRREHPHVKLPKLYRVPFASIDPTYYPNMLKWSHSNAVTLEKHGYDAAAAFAEALRSDDKAEFERKYRYYNHVEQQDRRSNQFARLFADLFEPEQRRAAT